MKLLEQPVCRTKEPLTPEEEKRVLEACRNSFEKQTVLVLLDTGIHVSLLPLLTKDNVKGGRITWKRTKKKGADAIVSVPISKRISPFIEKYVQLEKPKDRWFYWDMVKKIGRRAGIDDLSPLSFRHTFGVRMLEMGLKIPEVQRYMGVSTIKTILRYTKYKDVMTEEKLKKSGWID